MDYIYIHSLGTPRGPQRWVWEYCWGQDEKSQEWIDKQIYQNLTGYLEMSLNLWCSEGNFFFPGVEFSQLSGIWLKRLGMWLLYPRWAVTLIISDLWTFFWWETGYVDLWLIDCQQFFRNNNTSYREMVQKAWKQWGKTGYGSRSDPVSLA